jgi:hypothetical protein
MAKRKQPSKPLAPPPIAGERVPLGLRVTKETKAKLDQAAQSSGRSQSQEAEFRLEQTFNAENAVFDALDLAYGCHWTGLLMTLAQVGVRTGTRACSLSQRVYEGSEEWMSDPYAYGQVVRAVNFVLEALRPPGAATTPPDTLGLPPTSYLNLGAAFAQTALAAIVKPNEAQAQDSATQSIRKRLADLIPRIRIKSD